MSLKEKLQVVEADSSQNGTSPGEPVLQTTLKAIPPSRRQRSSDPQKSDRLLIRRSSLKSVNKLTRMSSVKFKNLLVRKSSEGTQFNSPNFLKETCCSNDKRTRTLLESSNSTPNSAHKSARLSRSKSKIRVIQKQSQVPELGVQRATCSSALKHMKSPPEVKDLEGEGSESEGVSATKPCPFTYCSLHGHHHATVPPLNTLISIRRHFLKNHKGTRSPLRVKKSGKIKEDEMNQMVSIGRGQVNEETCNKEDEDKIDMSIVSKKLYGEDSQESPQEASDLATVEQHALVSSSSVDNLCPEGCCIGTAFCENETVDFTLSTAKLPQEVVESTSDNEGHENSCASSLLTDINGNVMADKNESAECGMQVKSHKYITMWKLMYKHAVKGNTADVGKPLLLHGEDKEGQVKGTIGVLEIDEHTASTNHSAGDEKLELCQQNAIDLVQEAFDKIFLPEVLDNSYNDQSSDQEGLQLRNGGVEHGTLIASDSSEDRIVQNPGEYQLEAENDNAPKEKVIKVVEDRLELNMPKRWSSLKKFILLKRFVKAIEKVRNLSYRKPHYLSLELDPETGKINLRCQEVEDRRSADEWMLDYALQKVISRLPPAQQRKVALLVEAFETVLPFPDIRTHQMSKAIDSTKADRQCCNTLPIQNADETGKESDFGTSAKILSGSTSCSEENLSKCTDKFIDHKMNRQQGPLKSAMLKESSEDNPQFCIETSLKQGKDGSTSYEIIENKSVQEFRSEDISIRSLDCGIMSSDVESNNGETVSKVAKSDSSEEAVVPLAPIRCIEIPMAAGELSNGGGTTTKSGFFQGSPPSEESHSESSADVTNITLLEKQNYTRLWYFVYKHMVSNIAEKDGGETHDEIDEEHANNAEKKKNELRRIETVKRVEKAIDEILFPENQDESEDYQSNAGGLISEQEPPENKVGIGRKSFTTSSNFAKGSFRESNKKAGEYPEHILLISDNLVIVDEEKEVLMAEEKPKQKMSENWRNLKKMILLNRFIKALERGKKSDPRGPKYLPLKPDPEAEKVNLKHQNMNERKNAEEWMLDYALQNAVARLTPARNRKVALLVEAFETVIPDNGIPNPFKPVFIS